MKTFYLLVALLAFLLMQAVLASRIAIGEVTPDFVLLVVVFFALYRGPVQGAIFGFIVGFFQDLSNPELLGLNALTKSCLGYLVGQLGKKTFPESVLFLFGLFFTAAFGHDVVYLVFFKWPDVGSALLMVITVALPSAVYTAVFGVIVDRVVALFGAKVVTALGKKG